VRSISKPVGHDAMACTGRVVTVWSAIGLQSMQDIAQCSVTDAHMCTDAAAYFTENCLADLMRLFGIASL